MKTLYLRNVPDDVVARLERLAAIDGMSVSALAVRELAEVSRRVNNAEVLAGLPDLGIAMQEIVGDIDVSRAER